MIVDRHFRLDRIPGRSTRLDHCNFDLEVILCKIILEQIFFRILLASAPSISHYFESFGHDRPKFVAKMDYEKMEDEVIQIDSI